MSHNFKKKTKVMKGQSHIVLAYTAQSIQSRAGLSCRSCGFWTRVWPCFGLRVSARRVFPSLWLNFTSQGNFSGEVKGSWTTETNSLSPAGLDPHRLIIFNPINFFSLYELSWRSCVASLRTPVIPVVSGSSGSWTWRSDVESTEGKRFEFMCRARLVT